MLIRPSRPQDLGAVTGLLGVADLPLVGVDEHFSEFVVADDNGAIVGAAGLERYGRAGLLRSVAVHPRFRGRGLAQAMIGRLLADARAAGIDEVYLLTETAPAYFARLGFVPIRREEVAAPVTASAEFGACCATAQAMRLVLEEAGNRP